MSGSKSDEAIVEARKATFSESKLRLLEQRMQGLGLEADEGIKPRVPGARIPLSAEQRRIWLHALQQPDLPVYNELVTIHKHGSFDHSFLEASFNEILRRHEAWRTSFSSEGDQIVHADIRVTLPLIDVSKLSSDKRESEALRIATEAARSPIRIDEFPLFRARVVRMSADEHRIYLTFHHIIFDGVSNERVFVPELSAIYTSLERGVPTTLPLPQVQYGDYSIWREKHVESPAVKCHLDWWLEKLSGELPALRLPEDHARPAMADHRGSVERISVPAPLAESLRQLSRSQGVTLYMTLLAAFNVLLFRYSGQDDLIVGSATDARRRPELEKVIGYFLDTFVVRTRPTPDLLFSQYLAQVRDSVLGGVAAADVPFDRLVKEINPKREPGRHPIFQVFFTMRPLLPPPVGDWRIGHSDVNVGTAKFDLHLEVSDIPGEMDARLFFRTDIWETPTIKRMAANWLVLLQSICENPDAALGKLPILASEETVNLLGQGGWNDTARAFPQTTLTSLIEDQVLRTPKSVAATYGGESWTYDELNCRAEFHASSLRAAGVTRGSVVAILLNRSLDMLAALIAVLKTGAAYLPLDLQMPPERMALLLQDSKPAAILTELSLAGQIASSAAIIVPVDADRGSLGSGAIDASKIEPPHGAGDPDDTAYLIYTSGTTGEPKAVEISHRSLVNLLWSMKRAPGFEPKDVLLAVTPISFDIAALELFLPLICGGTVAIASAEEAQDPYLLAGAISSSSCTVLQTTPARWRMLLVSGGENSRQSPTGKPTRLRRILCGGEALPRELADRLLATGAEVWNMYGPTETTIWSLIHRVRSASEKETSSVSVGRPIANTTAFVLDAQLQPLPIGVPGELFLGGAGLAKGYFCQPEKTEERFVKVESVGGARLYRTGDVAVRRADGTIEILGRNDNQVKVRGHRIELEAVEAAVLRHPGIVAAAARVWPESTGDSRLSAYIVSADGSPAPGLADMRAFLRNSLPESMIPSDVIPLPAIPLTRHGKVDRARLPAPSAPSSVQISSAPGFSVELKLARIWEELLGRNHFGLDDSFFDLGGHSVLVASLQQRIAKEFELRIPIVELFQSPTIRQQAVLAKETVEERLALPPGVIAIQPRGTRNRIFWVQTLSRNLAEAIGDDQPFFTVGLTKDDFTSLGITPNLQDIAECHIRKILTIQPQGPYIIGGHCNNGVLAFEIVSQLHALGLAVSLLILLDARNPLYMRPLDSMSFKLSYLRYAINRAGRMGLRQIRLNLQWRFRRLFRRMPKIGTAKTELRAIQEMIEDAALRYQPRKYEGEVLLVQASDRSPDVNLDREWREVVPHGLHSHYCEGHHTELLRTPNVRCVAAGIVSHLASIRVNALPPYPAGLSKRGELFADVEVNDKMAVRKG